MPALDRCDRAAADPQPQALVVTEAPEPGPELARYNRRIAAEREDWPKGVLEDCERVEAAHPDWSITFVREHTIEYETLPGFLAFDRRDGRKTQLFSPTAHALDRQLTRHDATGPLAGTDHLQGRPHGDCIACGYPWPCPPARRKLAKELEPAALAAFMWERLEEAAFDQPTMPVKVMFDRYISWTKRSIIP